VKVNVTKNHIPIKTKIMKYSYRWCFNRRRCEPLIAFPSIL